ncbi:RVT_3 domain-containing protein, partial [Cephalotus follicularis]
YQAVIKGLALAMHLEVQKIRVFSDSQLVINQINGEYEARGEEMIKYLSNVRSLTSKFQYYHFLRIPKTDNSGANILSKMATVKEIPRMRNVFREDMQNPTITENNNMMDIDVEASWMDPIISWLRDGLLPSDKMEARRITYRSNRFYLKDRIPYQKSDALPLLRCLRPTEVEYALKEVHEGICSNHFRGRSLSYNIVRQGYYWPTMHQDALDFMRKCDKCQRFARVSHQPNQPLTSIIACGVLLIGGLIFWDPYLKLQDEGSFYLLLLITSPNG